MSAAPSGRVAACVAVMRTKNLRPVVLSLLLFVLVENATWMAILVYAHQRGGSSEVGWVAVVQLVPAMLFAPLASFLADRYHRVRVLAVGHLSIAVASAVVAVAMVSDSPAGIVYLTATVLGTLMALPRPAVGALGPCVASSGEELVALNVCSGIMQSVGRVSGPMLSAVVLATSVPATVFWISAVLAVMAAVLVMRVRLLATVVEGDEKVSLGAIHTETLAGISLLRRERSPRRLVGILALTSVVVGALDVTTVVVAIEALKRNEGLSGVFAAMIGVGTLVGSAAGILLVGRRRLAPVLLLAGVVQVAPLIGFALPATVVSASAIFLLCGVGVSLVELSGQTLLQGITPDDLMARVFGVLEGLRMGGLAVGSFAVSVALSRFGVDTGLVIFTGLVLAVVALTARGALAIDAGRPEVDADLLALVRQVPMFAPLPAYSVEQLLQTFRRSEGAAGAVIMTEGDVGDSMFVIADGELEVLHGGSVIQTRHRGEHVGEMALLFDAPRSATVVAGTDVVLYELDRDPFLEAITGHPRSTARAHSQAMSRLATVTPEDAAD